MAQLRGLQEVVGELALLSPFTPGPDVIAPMPGSQANLLPVLLDATASMPARSAGTTALTPQAVLAAFGKASDPWGASGTQSVSYIHSGRGAGATGWPAIAGAPAGTIGAIFAGPQPINVASTPLFWVRVA